VSFYCWTLAFAGLSIACLLDRTGRRAYGITLCIGSLIGLPELISAVLSHHLASEEAMRRFGAFTPAPRLYQLTVPVLSLLALALSALWIWKTKRSELIYLWSLVAAGAMLGRSRAVTGIFFHEYHYEWLSNPFRLVLVLIIVVGVITARARWHRPLAVWTFAAAIVLYCAGGVYLAALCVTRTWSGLYQLQNYTRYKTQRLGAVKPLLPGATIAGSEEFCELAAVAEDQWVLGGVAVPRSVAVDNDQWELRTALNAYLEGKDRTEFAKAAQAAAGDWFWESPELQPKVSTSFMQKYDEVVRDPDRFLAQFGVRYVAIAAERAKTSYFRAGWTPLQRGPYWQIWEKNPFP